MTNVQDTGAALGIAVVTRASSGIGAMYPDRLDQRGYDFILIARRGEKLEEEAKQSD